MWGRIMTSFNCNHSFTDVPETSGCGSFVVAYLQPTTVIDRLPMYKWVMFHIYFVYKLCLVIILLIILLIYLY